MQCIYVKADCPPLKPWFGNALSQMDSLQDALFHLGLNPDCQEVAHVFQSIAKHKNRPRVHAHFNFEFYETCLFEVFDWLEDQWSDFRKLNVQSLYIDYDHESIKFPQSFFKTVKEFTLLKRLVLNCGDYFRILDKIERFLNGTHGMHRIATFLKDFANLEHLHLNIPSTEFEWPKLAHLTMLYAPLCTMEKECTFETLTKSRILIFWTRDSQIPVPLFYPHSKI